MGLEDTFTEYISKLCDIFDEIKRVLKEEGSCWVVIGDTYMNNSSYSEKGRQGFGKDKIGMIYKNKCGLSSKCLCQIPSRFAIEMCNRGWILRQNIIWAKGNPMPESVTDRCTKSHEYIFLLTKRPKYYFDNEAIKENSVSKVQLRKRKNGLSVEDEKKYGAGGNCDVAEKRNKRSVWNINTRSCREAHFAIFPCDLIQPMILAGSSEKGVCSECGKPYVRIVDRKRLKRTELSPDDSRYRPNTYAGAYAEINGKADAGYTETRTVGWKPTCSCNKEIIPAVILDPFIGSGTTGIVAEKLGRNWVGIELNPEYIKIAEKRIADAKLHPVKEKGSKKKKSNNEENNTIKQQLLF